MFDFPKLAATYQEALLGSIVPFWLKNSPDDRCGGYFNSLTETGDPFDADKSIEQQAWQTWAFARLYNTVGASDAWLQHARQGGQFLSQFAHEETFRCYGLVDRRGRPVSAAVDVCPDALVVKAYIQLHQATGDDEWAMMAKLTLSRLLDSRQARRMSQARTIDGFRTLCHLSEPLAVLEALLEAQPLLAEDVWKETIQLILEELLNEFVDKRQDILREWVLPEGGFVNTPEGRRLNPGLTFRAAGALHDLARETSNRKLALQAAAWTVHLCDWAWDNTAGGLDYWVDSKQQPILFPDWKQRWAWVHLEALAALAKAYFYTRHPDALNWLVKVHEYTVAHFADPEKGGWHLVLNRKAKPLFRVKATLTQGGANLIKPLLECWQITEQCAKLKSAAPVNRLRRYPQ